MADPKTPEGYEALERLVNYDQLPFLPAFIVKVRAEHATMLEKAKLWNALCEFMGATGVEWTKRWEEHVKAQERKANGGVAPLCARCGKQTSTPMFSGETCPCDNCGLGVGGR